MKISEALKNSLCEISVFANIGIRTEESFEEISSDDLQKYSAIIVGYKSFLDTKKYETVSTTPLIFMNSYQKYGVCFTQLGPKFEFVEKITKFDEIDENDEPKVITKTTIFEDSLGICQFFNDNIFNYDKVRKDELQKNRRFKKMDKPDLYALATLYHSEALNQASIEDSKQFLVEKFKETNRQKLLVDESKTQESQIVFRQEFEDTLKILTDSKDTNEFHPTNCILGSIVAQEVQKIVTRTDRPMYGLLVYDMMVQRAMVYSTDIYAL